MVTLARWLNAAEHIWENKIVFGSRWLLAPAYLTLIFSLAILAYKCFEHLGGLLLHFRSADESQTTAEVLTLVDLILVMNLVLMVLFVGYVNFISIIRPEKAEDWPKWMGYLDYSGLKLQLIGSIIAISGIKLLRVFVDMIGADHIDLTRVLLMIGLHLTFVLSALIVAIVNKLSVKTAATAKSPHLESDS
jgi:uncharacterized protein (TIGR00645 family)